ncbi:thiamine-monophosphate kinase [Arthrobacter pigmenti]|uniref:Thiamine-monophosphate kinase n=1 Tax=Arthrobacter pigmenti TaxID=271432 RepID=A0A846RH95_9MICC|nr:thiamine-phosphate kinase [Arthrobacter pigmenti]NJC22618.1 thiamine-monophosphate kinase [Arthrobacter pigmenti]
MPLTVAQLSESDLLERIFPRLRTGIPWQECVVVGPGDDAAVLAVADGRVVVSIDTQVQDMDFRLQWPSGYHTTGFDVGWKAAAQNLSDINAMGGRATSLAVSLTLPGSTDVQWVEDLADGLNAAIRQLGADGCSVIGGDIGAGAQIAVTAAVTGSLEGRKPVLRSGAQPGDVVVLAGTVGRAAAGLALLESTHEYSSLQAEHLNLVQNQCCPLPPLAAGPAAAEAGSTAMLDISDGLVKDAQRLASASGVRIDFDPEVLSSLAEPLRSAADLLGIDPMEWVLGGGEDHGLLATVNPIVMPLPGFTAVGSVKAGSKGVTIGSQSPANVGWDHFAD